MRLSELFIELQTFARIGIRVVHPRELSVKTHRIVIVIQVVTLGANVQQW